MEDKTLIDLPISLNELFEAMPVALGLVSRDGRYITLNQALASMGGFEVKDLIGKKTSIVSVQSLENSNRDFTAFDHNESIPDHELILGQKTYHVSVKPLKDQLGAVIAEMVALTDITKNKLAEQELIEANRKLEHYANHDYLIGVLNARTYYEKADQLMEIARSEKIPFSVIFIDLNHFKHINDTYGHQIGDEVLKKVAGSIVHVCRKADLVGRLGGDEFSVFAYDADRAETIKLSERITESIESIVVNVDEEEINISASIGIGYGDDRGKSLYNVQNEADIAMYAVKKGRKDGTL